MRPRHVVLLISHAAEPRLPPATPLESTRRFARFWWDLTPFRINTSGSVHSKQLYLPLESTLMKKGGRGDQLLLTRNTKEDFSPERPSGEKDLSSNSKIEDSGLVGKDFYPEGALRPRNLSR